MSDQTELFKNIDVSKFQKTKEYGKFTDKFKTKLTTDDCYTPDAIYEAVKDWTVKEYHLEGREIVRPFWPGGDFEKFDYPKNCVVIDNPPFSLYNEILKFYMENGIDFFLFGPSLTLFKKFDCCYIVTSEVVTYENGAKVNTSFATNLDKVYRVRTCPTLKVAIKSAENKQKPLKKEIQLLKYPNNVISSSILGKTSKVDFNVKREDASYITKIGKERIFGSAFLLSDRAAADRAAADRAAERKTTIRVLGAEELKIIEKLNSKGNATPWQISSTQP